MHKSVRRPLRPHLVAIGGSAGGIEALLELLSLLPWDLPAIVVATIHRDVHAKSNLLSILSASTRMPVLAANDGEVLHAGVCYIGLPDKHLAIAPGLRARFIYDGFYRAHNIDLLFSSAARHAGRRVIGVVLSGLMSDGTEGLIAIKEHGGIALVQSPEEALFAQMPSSAIAYDGKIDFIGNVSDLAKEVCRRVGATKLSLPS